ncbi:hypothetical protein [Gluconacetobacter diazotrophicus]|uniref:Uncharacterized protein n=1 Tax=Gluconacetobacter diazotrophicus TaxID=33996 RepID=A0A7W4FBN1_GLUDI|nr:hypothetical protein [Gluconacetobacter diazotrophicus]MBB2154764.1 hypothetical protein [Gluconacetobacter diazotrophicus]
MLTEIEARDPVVIKVIVDELITEFPIAADIIAEVLLQHDAWLAAMEYLCAPADETEVKAEARMIDMEKTVLVTGSKSHA